MDVKFFSEHGYQILKSVIDPEVITLIRDFLESASNQAIDALHETLGSDGIPSLCAKIGAMAVQTDIDADRELMMIISGHFPLSVRLSPILWILAKQPRLRAILETVLEDEKLFMHMPPTARFILPGNARAGVPPHQDISYNKHMTDFVTVWAPLTVIDDRCGGVAVFEGSNAPVERLSDYKKEIWLKGVATDSFQRIHCKMDPGDVLLLNRWIVHESVPNFSNQIRYSVDFRFFGSRQHSRKHYLDLQSWKVHEPEL